MRSIPAVRTATVLVLTILAAPAAAAQAPSDGYRDARALDRAAAALVARHGRLAAIERPATSAGGLPLPVLTLGAGERGMRPAILVIANAHGPHVVGSEVVLRAAGRLLEDHGRDTAVTRLLDSVTIYLLPRANPDAAESFFQRPLRERVRNAEAWDDDRDWREDEDGPDDLDGDGVIAMMRVEDPAGEWLADSADSRLMRKADAQKGERATHRYLPEGRDDDGDERWNEDPPGGTDVGRNFSYDFPHFGAGAGEHAMSSAEARAIAQFVAEHDDIAAIYVLGPQDNLITPWEGKALPAEGVRPGTSAGGPLRAILKEDEPWLAEVARRFRELTDREKGPASAALGGDPLSWAYFHMGRWAFGSRVWWPPEVAPDSTAADSARPRPRSDAKDPLEAERKALAWLEREVPDAVLPWKRIDHPDFPGRTVEVGGIRPFALLNPPSALLDSLAAEQARFLVALGGMLPRVGVRNERVEPLGGGLFRIRAEIANHGFLPTSTKLGTEVRMPRPVRVQLLVGDDQAVAGGRASELLDPIPGSGGGVERTWLVRGRTGSTVTLRAGSASTGVVTRSITLR